MPPTTMTRSLIAWREAGADPRHLPVDEVVATVRTGGKLALDDATLRSLRGAADDLGDEPGLVADLLWSLLDVAEGRLSYASYLGERLLVHADEPGPATERVRDALVEAALRRELGGARAAADPERRSVHQRRARSLARYLAGSPHLVADSPAADPDHLVAAPTIESSRWVGVTDDTARRVAASELPMTTVADEPLFLRMVQALELDFGHWTDLARDAAHAVHHGHPGAFAASADRLERAITSSQLLLRALASLEPAEFARIREATRGASAIQSGRYRTFEAACQEADGLADRASAALERADDATRADVERRIDAIERAHHRWKRLHVGLARHLIGEAEGTGGTAGAAYLSAIVDQRLLPLPGLEAGPIDTGDT